MSDATKQAQHNDSIHNYEAEVNGEQPRKYVKKCDDPEEVITITAKEGQRLELRENLGVWWPEKLWIDTHPTQKALKCELQSLPGKGKGVIRNEGHGRPIGTVDLSMIDSKEVERLKQLHISTEDKREGETQDVWQAVKARSTVVSKTKNIGTEAEPRVGHSISFGNVATKKKTDEDNLRSKSTLVSTQRLRF